MRTRIPGAVGTLFALDMAVKQYIEENVSETEEKSLCGTGILIRKVYNKGFAFNSMEFFIYHTSDICKISFIRSL